MLENVEFELDNVILVYPVFGRLTDEGVLVASGP